MPDDDTAIMMKVDEAFYEASMGYVMNQLRRPEDYSRVHKITEKAAAERTALEKEFKSSFEERVEAERARLLDQTVKLKHDHPAPPGMPRNTEYSIEQTARRNVLLAHEGDLQRVDWTTNQALTDLMDQVRSRDARQGDAVREFNQATERRKGPDRRS